MFLTNYFLILFKWKIILEIIFENNFTLGTLILFSNLFQIKNNSFNSENPPAQNFTKTPLNFSKIIF
jgi:hypothetical protein